MKRVVVACLIGWVMGWWASQWLRPRRANGNKHHSQFQFNKAIHKERSENQSILERQSINLLIDGAVMVDWTSGKPTSFARRQAHSSHLCFVGPLCAIKNKERDEMEGFVAASRMSFRWFRSFSLHFINSIFYFYNKFHFMKLKLNFLLLSLTPPPRWRSLLHSKKTFTFLWLRIVGYGLNEPSGEVRERLVWFIKEEEKCSLGWLGGEGNK